MKNMLRLSLIIISLFFATESFAEKPFNEVLNEFLKEAPSLKDSAVQNSVDPKYAVNAQIDGYTEEPKEMSHYHEEKSDTAKMQQEAARMTTLDVEENPKENAGQAVIQSFKKRPVYKLTWDDPDIKKAKHAEDHPEEYVKLDVSSKTNCEKKKTTKCEETFSEKTCNEQVRALVKVCEKVPKITTSIKNTAYPNCQSVVITQGASAACPGGYNQILYMDMLEGPIYDDVRICVKAATIGESLECLGGYMVYGKNGNIQSTERVTVPKKLHARVRISNVYGMPIVGTIVNETTGQIIHNNAGFSNGQVIELPYSDTQDQSFRFYATQGGCKGWYCTRAIGVMLLYIDHIAKERVANLESWSETNCSEI